MRDDFEVIRQAIIDDETNTVMRERGWGPLFTASASSTIVLIGQAPGIKAQTSGVPWDDLSGKRLMDWLGVTAEQFRNPSLFALVPMDFYYPGKGPSGDLPPRKGVAQRWHPPLFELMPNVQLILLVGRYAQTHYIPSARRVTLTETVREYRQFGPEFFPLVHPSPLNFRWHTNNPWFVTDVLPDLREAVRDALRGTEADPSRQER